MKRFFLRTTIKKTSNDFVHLKFLFTCIKFFIYLFWNFFKTNTENERILAANPCNLPMEIGKGDHRLTRWRFSINENKCVSFIYRGLGGNQVDIKSMLFI